MWCDLCLNLWYDLWQDELNPRVRCAFGNVYNGWIMTTLTILLVIASKNRCDVAAGTGYNTLMEMLMITRPSILCGTHQISRKETRPSVNYAKDWLGQLFLIPGLVSSGKGYHLWMWSLWGSQQPFSCVLGHFRHVDTQPTNQVPSALDQWESNLLQFSLHHAVFGHLFVRFWRWISPYTHTDH